MRLNRIELCLEHKLWLSVDFNVYIKGQKKTEKYDSCVLVNWQGLKYQEKKNHFCNLLESAIIEIIFQHSRFGISKAIQNPKKLLYLKCLRNSGFQKSLIATSFRLGFSTLR